MYRAIIRPLVRAAFLAVAAVVLFVALAHIGRNWDVQTNRLTSVQIGIERELRKLVRR